MNSPLLALSDESNVRLAGTTDGRLGLVLRAVEDEYRSVNRLGRDEVGVLRHIPRAVDLALVVDRLLHADAC